MKSKEDSEGKNLYGLLGIIVGLNLFISWIPYLRFSMIYTLFFYGVIIYIFYRSLNHIVKYKKYKNSVIIMISTILITLFFSFIRITF